MYRICVDPRSYMKDRIYNIEIGMILFFYILESSASLSSMIL